MSKANIKLTYFNAKGLSEGIRFILAYADADFEDIRIEKEDWPAMKEKQPYGTLPILEIDGKILNQSVAICRYMGKYHGFVDKEDPMKEALLEALIDNIRDAMQVLMRSFANHTPENEAAARDALKFVLDRIEKVAVDGYFYGSKPTWVDMYFAGFADSLRDYKPDFLNNYPNLTKLVSNIMNKDSVQKYIAKRPTPPIHQH